MNNFCCTKSRNLHSLSNICARYIIENNIADGFVLDSASARLILEHLYMYKTCKFTDSLLISCSSLEEVVIYIPTRKYADLTVSGFEKAAQIWSEYLLHLELSVSPDYEIDEDSIDSCVVNDETLRVVGKHCSNLRNLTIKNCSAITHAGLEGLLENNDLLECLILPWCRNICNKCMIAVARLCPNLHTIDVSGTRVTDVGLLCFDNHNDENDEKVHNMFSITASPLEGLSLAGICAILQKYEGLREIKVGNFSNKAFGGLNPNEVETRDVSQCSCESESQDGDGDDGHDAFVNELCQAKCLRSGFQALNFWQFSWLFPKSFTKIVDCMCGPHLVEVCFSGATFLRPCDIDHLFQTCPSLRVVDLTESSPWSLLDSGSSESVIRKERNKLPSNLTVMKLGWTEIEDGHIVQLAHECGGIQQLNLRGCESLTDKAICQIAEHCSLLVKLDLERIGDISDEAFIAVSKCANLEKLSIAWCDNVTDEGLIESVPNFVSLRMLNLEGCKRITDRGVLALAQWNPHIQYLSVMWVNAITNECYDAVIKMCRDCVLVDYYGDHLQQSDLE